MLKVKVKENLKTEVLALIFGVLIILITFGDNRVYDFVGNLDIIFGLSFWRAMDVLYPLASIVVFLLYGAAKGGIRIHMLTILAFIIFLMALFMMIIDDIFIAVGISIELPHIYWVVVSGVYPFVSAVLFLAFGWLCARLKASPSRINTI